MPARKLKTFGQVCSKTRQMLVHKSMTSFNAPDFNRETALVIKFLNYGMCRIKKNTEKILFNNFFRFHISKILFCKTQSVKIVLILLRCWQLIIQNFVVHCSGRKGKL